MFILESKVEIGSYIFNQVNEIEITKSVEELSDTAVIKLPTRFKVRQNGEQKFTEDAIKVGDKVTIAPHDGLFKSYAGVTGIITKVNAKSRGGQVGYLVSHGSFVWEESELKLVPSSTVTIIVSLPKQWSVVTSSVTSNVPVVR